LRDAHGRCGTCSSMGQLVSVGPGRLTRQRESARWQEMGSCSSSSRGLEWDGKCYCFSPARASFPLPLLGCGAGG
jgi:hypothetical protein